MPSDSFRLLKGSLAETRNESENDAEAKQHNKDKINYTNTYRGIDRKAQIRNKFRRILKLTPLESNQ